MANHTNPLPIQPGDAALRQLLIMLAQSARDFVACGPRRSQSDSRMVFAPACNVVTQHDTGQRARRVCKARGSPRWSVEDWQSREGLELPFTHFFATRRDAI